MPVILGGNTGIYLASLAPAFDPDAQAFITAASITDPTQQSAINQLVVDLKGYNIWTKFKAIYPFVGGTASQHKWNLKDPRDLDAAFRLVFSGGWTHSSTGALPNGTNAYANSFFVPATNVSLGSFSFGAYHNTSNIVSYRIFGIYNSSGGDGNSKAFLNTRVVLAIDTANNTTSYNTTGTFASNLGLNASNRNSSTSFKIYINTNSLTVTATANKLAGIPFYFSGTNGDYVSYCNQTIALGFLSLGMSDSEYTNFYNTIQAFQTTLNRQIP